ncbi:MAG TPA: hypothetical protein VGC80_09545, partial [Acetobacteraceae bacterium]
MAHPPARPPSPAADSWLMPLAVQIATAEQPANPSIALVASQPGEGTTTVAVGLAHALDSALRRRVAI